MKYAILILAFLLSGCSTLSVNLDNRVACTAAHDKGFIVSQYGGVGLASTLATADANVICSLPPPVVAK